MRISDWSSDVCSSDLSGSCALPHRARPWRPGRLRGALEVQTQVALSFRLDQMRRMAAYLPYPALHATHGGIWIAAPDGEVRGLGRGEAIARAAETPMIMLNAPLVGQRLGYPELSGLDLLELFAFVFPARFAVPTPKGFAHALGLAPPKDDADAAPFLRRAAEALLERMEVADWPEREGAWASAQSLYRLRWSWAPVVTARLKRPERDERWLFSRLPEWDEGAPRAQPRAVSVSEAESIDRLAALTGRGAEPRQGPRDYAATATSAFAPRRREGQPHLLPAQAGTGIGKTLGYLAPASLRAAKADGAGWVSTYPTAQQRHLDRECVRLFPEPKAHQQNGVVRKGRRN